MGEPKIGHRGKGTEGESIYGREVRGTGGVHRLQKRGCWQATAWSTSGGCGLEGVGRKNHGERQPCLEGELDEDRR